MASNQFACLTVGWSLLAYIQKGILKKMQDNMMLPG